MKVTTKEIMAITVVLCEHLDNCGYSEIELDKPTYWAIPEEHEHDAYSEPREFTLGDLEDDWGELCKMAENRDEAVGYGMVWLASVLRAVGQSIAC